MANIVFPGPKDPDQFPHWRFETLDIRHDPGSAAVWMEYRVDAPQCYTLQMLTDLLQLRDSLLALWRSERIEEFPFRYLVMAARRPGVFSLGGDLATFAEAIRRRDVSTLLTYATACVDLVYSYCRVLGQHRSTQRRIPTGREDEERLSARAQALLIDCQKAQGRLQGA